VGTNITGAPDTLTLSIDLPNGVAPVAEESMSLLIGVECTAWTTAVLNGLAKIGGLLAFQVGWLEAAEGRV